jgi:hypothetical protein
MSPSAATALAQSALNGDNTLSMTPEIDTSLN